MNKQKALKVVNAFLAAIFLSLILTVLLRPIMSYEIYSLAHPVLGFLLLALVATHVTLNWGWIKQNYFKKAPKKA